MSKTIFVTVVFLIITSQVFGIENPTAWWRAESNQVSAVLGFSVGSGDFNGDGYDDVIAGAMWYDNPEDGEGTVFVWYGSASGLGPEGNPTNADWRAESNQASSRFGNSVGSGDFNGDGYDDVIVGAYYYNNGQPVEGMVFVWYGSATGLGPDGNPTNADWKAESNQTGGAELGCSVGSGDFNGDGYDDVIAGADYYDNPQFNEGMVFVWYGSATGLGPDGTPTNADWKAESNQDAAYFGKVGSGDFNGDGYDDVISGSRYSNGQTCEGTAFVWYGSSAGLGPDGTPANADWKAESNQVDAYLGWSVSSGDFNGDTYGDVIAGAYEYTNGQSGEGMVFVWEGSASGLGPDGNPTNADWQAQSNQTDARLGYSVGSGDFNGDGYDDLIAGANYYANGQSYEGMVFVWEGSASGLGPDGTPTNADWQAESNQTWARLGRSVGSGDFNDDLKDDVIAGAWCYGNGQNEEGMVFVWRGALIGIEQESSSASVSPLSLSISPNPFSKLTKISFGRVQSAESVELKIYDITGHPIKQFNHLTIQPFNQVTWDGCDNLGKKLPSGVYFLKFQAGNFSDVQKAVLLK